VKVKLDENLPARLVANLASLGHDVDTVPDEGLGGQDDPPVWEAAQREGRFFVTQDLDFSDARKFAPGSHCGLLLVRLQVPTRAKLLRRITEIFAAELVEEWAGCLVVASEIKIRVRRPE